ncbi:SEL1-like repeat protein [Brevundimonas goettingensis]|uniref:SEL1-like repeat protein n=2 Tax=Brevundimonas goettingensis TaxID=2774190 RepID=A0A975C5A9_9CAUL|nr:SEL1-like repeat protein [Brevundimonas goettingensis]
MTLGEWLNTMIMDDGEDEEIVVPLSRRAHAADSFERRSRSRRLDDAYDREPGYSRESYAASSPSFSAPSHSDDTLQRVAASVDAIAARLEAAERRSTVAIQGVDQAVAGLVRRLDGADAETRTYGRRIDDISEELKEGHRRLRRFEQEVGPDTKATFGKVENGIGAIAARLYDIEERQRTSLNELRQRMDAAEKSVSALPHGQGVGTEAMAQVSARLDTAQAQTTEALRGLERSFAGLDQRLRAAEGRVEPEGSREAARFEKLAETLARQVDANRAEMIQRLDTAEREGRMDRIERAMAAINEQARAAEQRSAQGIDAMGREVLRIAQNLNGRMQAADARATTLDAAIQRVESGVSDKIARAGQAIAADLNSSLGDKLDRDMGRYAQAVEHRLNRTDDQHALALEKLGGEITRISDRLADRIAQSERKSAQALEDIGRRLTDSSARIEQTYDRASGELAERMRLSEERTARLLEEARERIESRVDRSSRAFDLPEPVEAPHAAPAAPSALSSSMAAASDLSQPDWRAAAFPEDDFGAAPDDIWSTDPLSSDERAPAPFPGRFGEPEAAADTAFDPARAVAEILASPRLAQPAAAEPVIEPSFSTPVFAQPAQAVAAPEVVPEPFAAPAFGGFGGADVEDALEATAAVAPDVFAPEAYSAEPEPAAAPKMSAGFGAPPAFDPADAFDAGPDEFSAETDFVDARAMRAGLSAGAAGGRVASTRSAIDAARAAMTVAPEAEEPRAGFGLKRGGKSRLQERLDKQAKSGSTIRKGLLASVTGMALVGALYTTNRLAGGEGFELPGMDGVRQALGLAPAAADTDLTDETTPLAAVALTGDATPTDAVPLPSSEAQSLFDQATEELSGGKPEGVATLTRAANMGLPAAQMKLVEMYESGEGGVARNRTEARLWARRAAGAGDPVAMRAYGMYLYDGVGGAQNRAEALDWLVKAAGRGDVNGQFNAAKIYEFGTQGVAPNPTEAYKWYLIAARQGDQEAKTAADRLAPTLSAAGRTSARAAVEAFQTEPLG